MTATACDPPSSPPEKTATNQQALTPLACPSAYPNWNEVGVAIDGTEHVRDLNTAGYAHYANNISYQSRLLLNPKIERVKLRYAQFDLESGYDNFKIYHYAGTAQRSGLLSTPYWEADVPVNHDAGKNYSYLDLGFETDSSVTRPGYKIDRVSYRCYQNPPTSPSNSLRIAKNSKHDGILIGTGDTIWVYAYQRAYSSLYVHLMGLAGTTNYDFDIYASSTDTKPSFGSSQWYGRAGTQNGAMKQEMLRIPASSSGRYIYFSITSLSGSGHFRFYVNEVQDAAPSYVPVRVYFVPTSDEKAQIRATLRKLTEAVYQASDGSIFLKDYEIWWDPNSSIPSGTWLGFSNTPGCQQQCLSGSPSHVTLCPNFFWKEATMSNTGKRNAGVFAAHEFFHCWAGITDEYRGDTQGGNDGMGGHSIMQGGLSWQGANITNISTALNFGRDYPGYWTSEFECTSDSYCQNRWPAPTPAAVCRSDIGWRGACGPPDPDNWWEMVWALSFSVFLETQTPDPQTFWTDIADNYPFGPFVSFTEHP